MPNRIHVPRLATAILLCGSLLGTVVTSVFAQSTPTPSATTAAQTSVGSVAASVATGQPTTADSDPTGYYLWRDDNGYHLRTHGPGAEHYFVARLTTTGTFKDVDKSMLEKDDHFKILKGGHTLVLQFHTFDGWDGVNFRIDGGEYLKLNLKLDSVEISTDNIFLGPKGAHPPTNPFRIEI